MVDRSYTSLRTGGVALALVAVTVSCSSQSSRANPEVSRTTVARGTTSTERGGPDAATSAVPITSAATTASTYVAGAASSTPPAYAGNIGVKVCDSYLGITPMAAGTPGDG